MILAIYGTTHSGKTSLATMIEQTSRESVSTIHTDAILALHSLHDPWNGHDDEVAPWHAREFHNLVLDEVMIASKDSHVVIVEGNALSPLVTSSWLHPDTQILLCRRSVSPLRMLRECRVTDRGRYTSATCMTGLSRHAMWHRTPLRDMEILYRTVAQRRDCHARRLS